jgi:hypothetical protein
LLVLTFLELETPLLMHSFGVLTATAISYDH